MADDKVDLPEDLLSLKMSDEPWTAKEESLRGNDEEKVFLELLDVSEADQTTLESSIPLSPQWLYAKPSEVKTGLSGSTGELRAPNSLSHGNYTDLNQREVWRQDGSQEKKYWRRPASEIDSSCHWREEERETGLLGRRDWRKEDRRVENFPIQETSDGRVLSSSERWNDANNRNPGHETWRDSKWSSRWGPDDKEENRTEKRTDVDEEVAHGDKQSFVGINHATSDRHTNSRDKWRPRHRMEVFPSGSTVYHSARGIVLEKGRAKGSNVGFAPGRGRSSIVESLPISRPLSAGPIGSTPPVLKNEYLCGKIGISADTFCYPRGKLLDIYRKQKLVPSFATFPVELENVPPITQVGPVDPLAFVAPEGEEEDILGDIWEGKTIISGVSYNSFRDKMGSSKENVADIGDIMLTEGEKGVLPSINTEENGETFMADENDDACKGCVCISNSYSSHMNTLGESVTSLKDEDEVAGGTNVVECDSIFPEVSKINACSTGEAGFSKLNASQIKAGEHWQIAGQEYIKGASFAINTNLPDGSSSPFDLLSLRKSLDSSEEYIKSNGEASLLERVTSPERVSLYYRDPQGEIQGPFRVVDIISWFHQGFFGTDLPVCLSDAPEGTPFQELGEVMPHLRQNAECASGTILFSKLDPCDATEGSSDAHKTAPASAPEFNSAVICDQQFASSKFDNLSSQQAHSITSKPKDPVILPCAESQSFCDFATQEEEITFPGKFGTSSVNPIGNPFGDLHDSLKDSVRNVFHGNGLADTSMLNHKDNKLHPFGLSWSELENNHLRHIQLYKTSSNFNMKATTDKDEGRLMNSVVGRDSPFTCHKQSSFNAKADSPVIPETWSDACVGSIFPNPNLTQDAIEPQLSQLEQKPSDFGFVEHLMSQQFQKQQLQQNNILPPHALDLNGLHLEQLPGSLSQCWIPVRNQQSVNQPVLDLEHILKLKLRHQLQLQLLQQQQLHQLQLHHHQMQLQHQQQKEDEVRQILLEQILHHRRPDPGFGQSHADPGRYNNMHEQILLRQHLLHELQWHSHSPRHLKPSLEQLMQLKFDRTPQQLISQEMCGQINPSEQLLFFDQEQIRARQLAMGSRQPLGVEEEDRCGVWSVNETGPQQAESVRFSPIDFHQQQHKLSSYEGQLSHLDQNLAIQERLQQGHYEPSLLAFETEVPFPAGSPRMNLDSNALIHAQGLDIQERQIHTGQVGSFSSDSHSYHPQAAVQVHASHLDALENYWVVNNHRLSNNWLEGQVQQSHVEAERYKMEAEPKMSSDDLSLWASAVGNRTSSKRVLVDMVSQKLDHQSYPLKEVRNGISISSHERREPSWLFSGSSSSSNVLNIFPDRKDGLNNSLEGQSSNSCNLLQDHVNMEMGDLSRYAQISGRLSTRSHSAALIDEESFLLGNGKTAQAIYDDSTMIGGNAGLYNYEMGLDNALGEDTAKDWATYHLSKGLDNSLLKHPPVPQVSLSQEVLSKDSPAVAKGKSQPSFASSSATQISAVLASGKKDASFQRSLSCSSTDGLEASFIDMLRSTAKKPVVPEADGISGASEPSDGAQSNRSCKKKGRKGKQIDPALLGFKVTSNRILMGEIHRPED